MNRFAQIVVGFFHQLRGRVFGLSSRQILAQLREALLAQVPSTMPAKGSFEHLAAAIPAGSWPEGEGQPGIVSLSPPALRRISYLDLEDLKQELSATLKARGVFSAGVSWELTRQGGICIKLHYHASEGDFWRSFLKATEVLSPGYVPPEAKPAKAA